MSQQNYRVGVFCEKCKKEVEVTHVSSPHKRTAIQVLKIQPLESFERTFVLVAFKLCKCQKEKGNAKTN